MIEHVSFFQIRSTSKFLGVSGVSLKIFRIQIYGFNLVTLYRTLCHAFYFYISVKFPGKDFLGQYISDFQRQLFADVLQNRCS